MTYNDILEEFKEFTGIKTVYDFRPCCELYGVPNINNAIVIWLDKSYQKKLIYISYVKRRIKMNLPTLILVLSLVFTGYGYESNYEQNEDTWAMDRAWNSMTEEQQYNAPVEYQANAVRMTVDEFMFMAAVVQAESDGTGSWTSCEAVAVCIFDRVYDPRFPDTVTKVLNEPGQFSTVVNGTSIKSATKDSRWGVILGYKAVYSGKYPTNLLYFNCIGYNYGYAYDYIGGNYFMTA